VIFLTIGTHEPFDRLVGAVDAWCGSRGRADVFGQIAASGEDRTPEHFEWVVKMPPDEYRAAYEKADLVVAHAGMGAIITALTLAKPILILPRRGHLRETRNDHQFATAQRFAEKPGVFVAWDETELPDLMDKLTAEGAAAGAAVGPYADDSLIDALRNIIQR
jgi:UDP-N-acetylglucosamine transferase subunit ALG13